MNKEYGYARISTPKQNIDRQVRNILVSHPQAHIVKEVYTGTKFQGRKELDKLLNKGKRLIFRYDRKIPDYFSVAGAP